MRSNDDLRWLESLMRSTDRAVMGNLSQPAEARRAEIRLSLEQAFERGVEVGRAQQPEAGERVHLARYRHYPEGYVVECECGWASPARSSSILAQEDYEAHVAETVAAPGAKEHTPVERGRDDECWIRCSCDFETRIHPCRTAAWAEFFAHRHKAERLARPAPREAADLGALLAEYLEVSARQAKTYIGDAEVRLLTAIVGELQGRAAKGQQ